ncbi:DUF7255 family protein [Mycolicibacterium sp.]|uniref:DUF7255 family protein n=1 Tax=Mycolicibacterium sp. TaxID=2320850 RepID=UPI003D147A11
MVRTGARAHALQQQLTRTGLSPAPAAPSAPRLDTLPEVARTAVSAVYEALGGARPMRAVRPGAWDLAFAGELVVELDEELHFNRYRHLTLQFPWATELPWRDTYLGYCTGQEQRCLDAGRWGKRWTSPSCEAMFGPATAAGDLDGAGAPRWKQRALYDAVKDIAAVHSSTVRLARLSVWDTVGHVVLGDALSTGSPIDPDRLRDLVGRRTTATP